MQDDQKATGAGDGVADKLNATADASSATANPPASQPSNGDTPPPPATATQAANSGANPAATPGKGDTGDKGGPKPGDDEKPPADETALVATDDTPEDLPSRADVKAEKMAAAIESPAGVPTIKHPNPSKLATRVYLVEIERQPVESSLGPAVVGPCVDEGDAQQVYFHHHGLMNPGGFLLKVTPPEDLKGDAA